MGLTQSSSYEIKDAGDKDVTKNYSISKVTDGYVKINADGLNETDFEVSGLSNHVYDGENHKDVPVVTKKGSKDALEEGTDYTVSYDTENFVDVKTIYCDDYWKRELQWSGNQDIPDHGTPD
ncbi:hypothetical protein [Sellimonas intestinalis]|uniref:hypothetical protein n=1 Tax=Sellimonas intestinalis TaxID=1653434 RepID=UPI00399AB4B0